MYCLDEILVPAVQSSVFLTKQIGLVRYGLVIDLCFLNNFEKFLYVSNLNPVCINNPLAIG